MYSVFEWDRIVLNRILRSSTKSQTLEFYYLSWICMNDYIRSIFLIQVTDFPGTSHNHSSFNPSYSVLSGIKDVRDSSSLRPWTTGPDGSIRKELVSWFNSVLSSDFLRKRALYFILYSVELFIISFGNSKNMFAPDGLDRTNVILDYS